MQKRILLAVIMMAVSVVLSGCTGQPTVYRNTAAITGDNVPSGDNTQPGVATEPTGAGTGQDGTVQAIMNTTASGDGCEQNSVYFIHADWCPHCQNMKPLVVNLQSQGYRFVMVTSDNIAAYKGCLTGVAQMQYIPEFVCLSNKQDHVGEFADESAIQAFADACGAGPQ